MFNGIGLQSGGPDGSFDTHIAISRQNICQMLYVSFMSKMPKMPYLRHMPFEVCHIWILKYECQKMRKEPRMAEQCY